MLRQVMDLGRLLRRQIEYFGRFVSFCTNALLWVVRDAPKRRRWELLLPQLFEVGTKSLPVVVITGGFIGMVLAIELYEQFHLLGQETRLGGVVFISVVKHVGPVLAAVMLAGRVGGAFSAELGTMSVTEQIDALRVMAADPVSYLVVPRVLACVIMIPILTVFADLIGIFGAWMITVVTFGVPHHDYWSFAQWFVRPWDVGTGIVKSICFGLAIGLICCYKGFYCGRGAQGVGRATTDAFVTSFVTIIVLNFFLAKLANDLDRMVHGVLDATAIG
jgi:phospholipid/cholesterol/gamma-HCH transport system permease protein